MEEAMNVLSEYSFWDIAKILFFTIPAIVILVRTLEKAAKKLSGIFLHLYKKKRGKEEAEETIETLSKKISQIEKQQTENVKKFTEHELDVLDKLDELSKKLDAFNEANEKVDRAILRDRIMGGMRFFSQNKDEHGKVHISMSDHENMSHLFEEYFARGGNGSIKSRYENAFEKFIIDD